MRLRWTPAAAADLEHISEYLKGRHPHYHQPTTRKLYDATSAVGNQLVNLGLQLGRETYFHTSQVTSRVVPTGKPGTPGELYDRLVRMRLKFLFPCKTATTWSGLVSGL
jgi:hypothetical protein